MSIIIAIIMTLFCGFSAAYLTFATFCSDRATLRRTKKEMKWAQENEDKWLPNTTTIVRNGDFLYFYPKNRYAIQKYGSGQIVHYGINKYETEYGIICNGDVVFGYRDFIESSLSAERFQYKDGVRLLYMGRQRTDKYGLEKVYQKEGTFEYYIIISNSYVRVYKRNNYYTTRRPI